MSVRHRRRLLPPPVSAGFCVHTVFLDQTHDLCHQSGSCLPLLLGNDYAEDGKMNECLLASFLYFIISASKKRGKQASKHINTV